MIRPERVQRLNDRPEKRGRYVLYWMQQAQRAEYNHALEYAIQKANEISKPLVVFFGLTDSFPDANERHYAFMLEGLKETRAALEKRGIRMVIRHESPETGCTEMARDASLGIADRGYLRIQKKWRAHVAEEIDCSLIRVESDVVVPVETASPKEEYAAATIRPKIRRQMNNFLVPLRKRRVKKDSLGLRFDSFDIEDVEKALSRLSIDRSVKSVSTFRGGISEAKKHLRRFIRERLDRFDELRNDPTEDCLSNMSPYLHFGQISPLYIALEILKAGSPSTEPYLEELIVRRELSMNFVHYNPDYDRYRALPGWCRKTLEKHKKDQREYVYSRKELDKAKTHDPYWNAAQREMVLTGKMHGYMRMYWGKKILEWSPTPEKAFRTALYLNNRYELDGRDPNGFTGVAWCFGKHDRPWGERPVFGKVRYMNANGLRRKFDADGYAGRIGRLERELPQEGSRLAAAAKDETKEYKKGDHPFMVPSPFYQKPERRVGIHFDTASPEAETGGRGERS